MRASRTRRQARRWASPASARCSRAAEVAALGGWRLDLATRRLLLTGSSAQLLGLEDRPTAIPLATILARLSPPARRLVARVLGRARRGRRLRFELPFSVDGTERWRRITALPVFGPSSVTALDGSAEDVTAQRLIEARRRSHERALNEAQKLAGIGAWWTDIGTAEVRWSEQLSRILGYAVGEVEPSFERYAKHVHPDDIEAYWARIRAGGIDAPTYRAEYRIVRTDGVVRRVLATSRPVHDQRRRLIGRFGVIQDVTEARETEDRLQAQAVMLREAQKLARIGAVWRRVDATVSSWSDEMYAMLGLDPATTCPSFETIHALVHPDDRRAHRRLVDELTLERETEGEFRIIRPDGEQRTLLARVRLERRDNGAPHLSASHLDITELKETERRLQSLAFFDPLTGLPNRAGFQQQVAALLTDPAAAERGAGALLLLDLDRFKEVNDTLGHAAGDRLLVAAAGRLRGELREIDLVARLGGDEVAIIVTPPISTDSLAGLAERLLVALRRAFEIEGQEIHVGGSIGIAIAGAAGVDGDTLLRRADLALYAAKEAGRDGYRFFEPRLNEAMLHRRAIERELRQAIRDDALALHYQPQLEIGSDRICGIEALVRWPRPDGSFMPPDRFVPIAESSGLILDLGAWVIERGVPEFAGLCRVLRQELTLAVNVSVAQLHDAALAARTAAALRRHGVPPHRLHLELTESVFADRRDGKIMAAVASLARLGVTLCLDDFGTGYSSLGYLADLPFRVLKIDRRFTALLGHDRRSAAIVPAVIGLGRSLGLTVVAEGVESEEQLRRLRGFGCDVAQGYLVGRPEPLPAITARLLGGATRAARGGPRALAG